ncbi:MAG: hypothetical protein ACRDMZ_19360 [Solirubrobacteraceae bacterium]
MRIKAIGGVASAVLAATLIGCGGGGAASDNDASGDRQTTSESADVKKLIEQTFGPNPKATSGVLSGTIDINVRGASRYRQPVQVTMSGPFNKPSGSAPEANLSVGLALRDGALGGELVLVDDRVLIALGTTGYQIPDAIAATIRKPLANSRNGLASILRVFGIAPDRWAKNPRLVGDERVAGVDTIHGRAELDTERFFLDVARLTKVLTSLRITEVTGLPRVIDRTTRQALARSTTSATGDVYTGAKDHVLRKAMFAMKLKPSAKDRKLLKFSSIDVSGELNVTEVGSEQTIKPPPSTGDYDALQITLDALAESVK